MQISCGIYLYSTFTGKFLICHATNAKKKQWSIPKGLRDPGETSFEGAARELLEETGIDIKDLHILAQYELPPVKYKKTNKTLESFFIITDTNLSNKELYCKTMVDEKFPEIDKYRWVDIEKMERRVHEAQVKNLEIINKIINEWVSKKQDQQ